MCISIYMYVYIYIYIHKLIIPESKFLGDSLWTQEFHPLKVKLRLCRGPGNLDFQFVDWP